MFLFRFFEQNCLDLHHQVKTKNEWFCRRLTDLDCFQVHARLPFYLHCHHQNKKQFCQSGATAFVYEPLLSLFPMLRQHCFPEDNVDRILARLVDEHREDEESVETVTDILRQSVSSQSIHANGGRMLRKFAEHIRQHLALENGVLLPIARVRLAEQELGVLADLLKSRRF